MQAQLEWREALEDQDYTGQIIKPCCSKIKLSETPALGSTVKNPHQTHIDEQYDAVKHLRWAKKEAIAYPVSGSSPRPMWFRSTGPRTLRQTDQLQASLGAWWICVQSPIGPPYCRRGRESVEPPSIRTGGVTLYWDGNVTEYCIKGCMEFRHLLSWRRVWPFCKARRDAHRGHRNGWSNVPQAPLLFQRIGSSTRSSDRSPVF